MQITFPALKGRLLKDAFPFLSGFDSATLTNDPGGMKYNLQFCLLKFDGNCTLRSFLSGAATGQSRFTPPMRFTLKPVLRDFGAQETPWFPQTTMGSFKPFTITKSSSS